MTISSGPVRPSPGPGALFEVTPMSADWEYLGFSVVEVTAELRGGCADVLTCPTDSLSTVQAEAHQRRNRTLAPVARVVALSRHRGTSLGAASGRRGKGR